MISLLMPSSARADGAEFRVRLECNPQQHTLVIHFVGIQGDTTAVESYAWRARDIDPSQLIIYGEPNEAGDIQTWADRKLTRACKLGPNRYVIEIQPNVAHRWKPTGHCAVRVGAMVTVTLSGKRVGRMQNDHCDQSFGEEMVRRSMVVTLGQPVRFADVRADQFDLAVSKP